MYLAVGTRPDISFAVSRLGQFVDHPTRQLWVEVKRILRYICGTKDLGITYSSDSRLYPVGYSDSDWEDARSIESLQVDSCLQSLEEPLAGSRKKQGCVAQSSSEAEYMALASAVKEAIWVQNIFGLTAAQSEKKPVLVFVDNQGAIKMAKKDLSSTRTKHNRHSVSFCLRLLGEEPVLNRLLSYKRYVC